MVRALHARAGVLLLINQLNLPEGLRAYGSRFGGNVAHGILLGAPILLELVDRLSF